VPVIAVGSEAVARITWASQSSRLRTDMLPGFIMALPDLRDKDTSVAIRSEDSTYEFCSDGKGGFTVARSLGDVGDTGQRVYIVSSLTNWLVHEEMQQTIDGYIHFLKLGDSQEAQFYIVLDKDPERTIYPSSHDANADADIAGPDNASAGRRWKIDGRRRNGGSVYLINFSWDYGVRQMSWTVVTAHMKHGFSKAVQELIDADTSTTSPDHETASSDASTADT